MPLILKNLIQKYLSIYDVYGHMTCGSHKFFFSIRGNIGSMLLMTAPD